MMTQQLFLQIRQGWIYVQEQNLRLKNKKVTNKSYFNSYVNIIWITKQFIITKTVNDIHEVS